MDSDRKAEDTQDSKGDQEASKFRVSIRVEGEPGSFQFTCTDCRFERSRKTILVIRDPTNALEHTLKHGDYCDDTHPQYLAILGKLEAIILNAQEQESVIEVKLKKLGEDIKNKYISGRSY